MKSTVVKALQGGLIGASLSLLAMVAWPADARPLPPFMAGPEADRHAPPPQGWGRNDAIPPLPGMPGLPPLPDLTDAQDDQIFEILHDQARTMHQRMRALHKAELALAEGSRTAGADVTKLRQLADNLGKATADVIALRLQAHARILAVLTPEQQKLLPPPPGTGPERS